MGAKTGNSIAVVARFEVISVKKLTDAMIWIEEYGLDDD